MASRELWPLLLLSMFKPRALQDGFSSIAKIISDFPFQEFTPLTIVHRYLEGAMLVNIVAFLESWKPQSQIYSLKLRDRNSSDNVILGTFQI